jgi:hypothetical protein
MDDHTLQAARDIANEMIRVFKGARVPVTLEGVRGYNPLKEINEGLISAIDQGGGEILQVNTIYEGMQGEAVGVMRRIEYRAQNNQRVAYIISSRIDIDAFGEESLVFDLENDPREGVFSLFEEARRLDKQKHQAAHERLVALDARVPVAFRNTLLVDRIREVAKNFYLAGGHLSRDVFEPYKGTSAYPATENEALEHFEGKHPELRETFLLVGELIAKDLIELNPKIQNAPPPPKAEDESASPTLN